MTAGEAPLVASIDDSLRAAGDPERAQWNQKYLKSDLEHYGVSVPEIRAVARRVRSDNPDLDHDRVASLAVGLWSEPVHDRRVAAIEVLGCYGHLLGPDDMELFERLLRDAGTWALVDPLAVSVVSQVVERSSTAATELDRWAVDHDVWIRRSALLALLVPLRRGRGDFERFGRYADQMLDETEFFIRKAIGWVLRDTARRRPDMVVDWLLPRTARASGVTLREAVKPLSEQQRAAVLSSR